jgi:membrane protein YqaA with SNARE-associated domain
MAWGSLLTVFFTATVKFMFAPFAGNGMGLPFWETFLAAFAGGTFGSAVFYFFSESVMKISHNQKVKKHEELERKGIAIPVKKKFSKTNKFIIRIKHKLGMYGICFWAPFLLSVPIGSIVVAKFYGKLHKTFPLVILGMAINSLVMTSIAYLLF